MRTRQFIATMACLAILLIWSSPVRGDIQIIESQEKWEAAAGDFSTIYFNEVPEFTIVTDQYQHLGVTFMTGQAVTYYGSFNFPDDHYGLTAGFVDYIEVEFDEPMQWTGVKFPGFLTIQLYDDEELLVEQFFNQPGITSFGGFISDQPFDRVVMFDPTGSTTIDDLMFGPPIPTPGALPLLGLALLAHQRRRRR